MPAAGQMRHRITVTAITLEDRPDGGQTPVETVVYTQAPCVFTPISFDERLQAGTQYATATHRAVLWLDVSKPEILPPGHADVLDPYRGVTTRYELTSVIPQMPDLELVLTERVT